MSYEVLARKYRPMSFTDLVGQEHVARTLKNAIDSGRVAHAFLFTGVRGVGKTTSARILAKALNCMRPPGTVTDGEDPGPTHAPCLECAACEEIRIGTDVDVREIDGASYNGVDEVRKLQDSLPYRPARDRYKIFIIDEVHMLSQAAWNAFLKTLEEPPPHVKFIFATTEVQKVPITILSRCQRFDFKLIPTQVIAKRLEEVLSKEDIDADAASVSVVAREAAGSMRDAMSLLDQVIAWGGEKLTGDDVARVLGVASHQILHDLASALVAGNAGRCIEIVGELSNQGYDIAHVARDTLALLRDLVVAKVCKDPGELVDRADDERKDIAELASKTDADDLVRLHQGFSTGFDDIVRGGHPRAAIEMLLVRLARRPPLVPVDDLVARLGALEKRLSGGGAPTPGPERGPRGRGGGGREPRRDGGSSAGRARQREPKSSAPSPRPAPEAHLDEPPSGPPPSFDEIESAQPVEGPRAAPPPRSGPRASERPREPQRGAASSRAPDAPAPAVPPPSDAPPPSVDGSKSGHWRQIIERVRKSAPEVAAVLQHAAPLEVGPDKLLLGYERGSVFEKKAGAKEAVALLTRATREYFDTETEVVFDFESRNASAVETIAAADLREKQQRRDAQRELARQHPMVGEVVEVLGGRLKRVELEDD